ncbi:MAG: hypothetical protein KJ063_02020 [Anaerolineae bacterium]|nr:hypothetical protein [Anaerolineae bacterium]
MSSGKKIRRVRRPQSTPSRAATPAPITSPAPKPQYASSEEELREEYAYVLQDLRRVFILAAAMFLLLILVNIFLL